MKNIPPIPNLSFLRKDWNYIEGGKFTFVGCKLVDTEIVRDGGTCEISLVRNGKLCTLSRQFTIGLIGTKYYGVFLLWEPAEKRVSLLDPHQISGLEDFIEKNRDAIPENIREGFLRVVD